METETKPEYFINRYPVKSLAELASIKNRKPNQPTLRLVVVAANETDHWADEIQAKAKGPIYAVYLVDLTQPTHCCSFQVDYYARFLMNHFTDVSTWQDENGDWLPGMDNELTELEFTDGDSDGSYFSENSTFKILDEVRLSNKRYQKELSFEGSHDKWIESYIEHYKGNWPI
jgi:hypothetical protein